MRDLAAEGTVQLQQKRPLLERLDEGMAVQIPWELGHRIITE